MTNTVKTIKSDYQARKQTRAYNYFSTNTWSNWSTTNVASIPGDTVITYGPDYVDWKDRIYKRMNATTSLSVDAVYVSEHQNYDLIWFSQKSLIFAPIGYIQRFEMRGNLGSPTTGYPSALTLGTPVTSRVHNQVVSGFVKKAISAQRTFSGGVFLGELKEAIHLIRHPLLSLRRGFDDYLGAVRALARPKTKRDREISKRINRYSDPVERKLAHKQALSDTWLEYSFGLVPTVSDVDDGLKTLANFLNYRPPTKFISFVAEETSKLSRLRNDLSALNMTLERVYIRSNKYSERIYGIISLQNDLTAVGTDLATVLTTTGLDLRSFVPTLYELIPYSFLVDYFANIGDIIEAACFNRSSVQWASIGTLHQQSLKLLSCTFNPTADFGYKMLEVSPNPGPDFFYAFMKKTRNIYSDSYIPSLEIKLPLTVNKILNMGALLASSTYSSKLSARSFRI
jgi:hypothetical protein